MKEVKRVAVIPGDGTGPEVIGEGLKVIKAVSGSLGCDIEFKHFDFGGERYMRTGETLPDGAIDELKTFDAIYLGAIGHPDIKPGILEKGILLKLRFELDQYINLRPVRLFPGVETPLKGKGPEDIDYTVVRENSGDVYTGMGGAMMVGTKDEVATQVMAYSRKQVDRCLRYAFEYARKYGKAARGKADQSKLALVGKSNVLTYVFDMWNRAFAEIGEEYPDIKREYYHVDATTLYQVASPEMFDVVVTTNLFGDIITDLAAITQGGLGVAAGGNLNPEGVSMFEPIGGTAPMWTGQNKINPLAAIWSGAMLLQSLGEEKAGDAIVEAIGDTTPKMKSMAAGQMGFSTTEVGDMVAEAALKRLS